MSLKTRWIGLIYEVATGNRKIRNLLTPVVGLSYFLFSSLFVISALLCDHYADTPKFPVSPVNYFPGILLTLAGFLLIIWCLSNFIKVKGTPVPFNPPPRLVSSGPYAFVRNPMLGGVFLLLFGLGFTLQSIFLIFVFTPLFILINVSEIKMIEEPELALRLGRDYLDYKKRTPMFIPIQWKNFKDNKI